jgi:hypothetical protein
VNDPAVCGANCGKVLVVGDNLTDPVADLYTPDPTPMRCLVTALRAGPPKQMDVTVTDAGGLNGIANVSITNGTISTSPSPIPAGSTSFVVTATKTDPSQPTVWSFDAVDNEGNTHRCT